MFLGTRKRCVDFMNVHGLLGFPADYTEQTLQLHPEAGPHLEVEEEIDAGIDGRKEVYQAESEKDQILVFACNSKPR